MYRQSKFAMASCGLAVALGMTTAAYAAQPDADAVDKAANRYPLSIVADKAQRAHAHELQRRQEQRAEQFGPVGGVSQATLDAIGACESGGDPTAVDASGTYYGKYQFDVGTWASVGGSGSPADASEAEQDYRASILYSRAGSSPWPVCGV